MSEPNHHAGTVAVIGRPNVGKSTLVNALVGAKISITSNRPQTTRHRLLGIATFPEGQLLLVDNPWSRRCWACCPSSRRSMARTRSPTRASASSPANCCASS